MTEALTSNYWISPNAVRITLNAMGKKDYIQCGAVGGAVIMCYMRDIDGLGYDAGHNYRRWPIVTAPVYFNSWTRKYVYIAIPRSTAVGTSAILVFPSERIDLYGMTEPAEGETEGKQIGSKDYYYIFLRGVISPSRSDGGADQLREWEEYVDYGTLSTDQQVSEGDAEWWRYNADDDTVTFLKVITNATFKVLNVLKNLTVGGDGSFGGSLTVAKDAIVNGLFTAYSAIINSVHSSNYTGSGMADTGWSIRNDNGNGDSQAVFDYLTIRKKMIVQSLEIKETHFSAGDIAQSCASAEINRTDYYYIDENGNYNLLGYSVVKVPWLLRGISFLLRKNDPLGVFSKKKKVRIVLDNDNLKLCNCIRCYFRAKDGEKSVENWWRENDLARCQTWNVTQAQRETFIPDLNDHAGNIYWWRKVINTSWNTGLPRYLLSDENGNPLDSSDPENITTDPNDPRGVYINEAGIKYEVSHGTYNNDIHTQTYKDHQPAVIDKETYHWFDVAFDYTEEQEAFSHGHRTNHCDLYSDIPAAGDKVVQFGNTTDPDRMNLMLWEVNGAGNIDAPSWKMYAGLYTFDLNLCWWGGTPQKTKWSYRTGIKVFAPKFEWITEYGVGRQAFDRGHWSDLPLERDDDTRLHNLDDYPLYSDDIKNPDGSFKSRKGGLARNYIRKCRYYDRVSHDGSMWLCSIVESQYWIAKDNFTTSTGDVYAAGDRVSNFSTLIPEDKEHCEQVRSYTFDEPGYSSLDWTEVVEKGADGSFKSRVFCRSNATPQKPSDATVTIGGITYNTFNNPVPPPESGQPTWTDGAPNGQAILWSSTAWFYPNGTHTQWTSPAPETDTADLDIEFSPNYTKPEAPYGNDAAQKDSAEYQIRRHAQGWYDPTLDSSQDWDNMIWRAERKIKNGQYIGTWSISRIKGEQGNTPVSAYRWYKEEAVATTAPTAPTGDTANPNATDHTTDNKAYPAATWSQYAPNRPAKGWILYMTYGYRFNDGTYGQWATPILISGVDGTPGEDADNIEWIYKFDDNGYDGPTGQVNPTSAASGSDTNKAQKNWVPNGWYDHAQGVSKDNPILYASFRDITSDAANNKTYGAFNPPIIWSHFGRNGMDGDGFEYVFVRTTTNTPPTIVVKPNDYEDSQHRKYTDDEFLPKALVNGSEVECTDDPQSVDPINKYVWVAKRTKGSANADTGVRTWEKYSGTMSIWNNWAENAVRLDLDNENDSMLYTGGGTLVSGNVVTTGYLYNGMTDVSSQATWSIDSFSGCTASISGRTVTVTAMSATSGSVVVKAVYMDKEYKATLTLKKIVDGDKYDLVVTPNSIAYNATNDQPAESTLTIQVWKTSINNSGGVTRALDNPPGDYKVFAGTTQLTASSTGTYSHITDNSAIDEVQIKIAQSAASTDVLDAETVPVTKAENGVGIVSVTKQYSISQYGTTVDDEHAPADASWQAGSPTVTEAKPYLWVYEYTLFSNGVYTSRYYCIGRRGDNGIDAKDAEWAYIRTKTDVAPVIDNDVAYTDHNGNTYYADDHLPKVVAGSGGSASDIESNNSGDASKPYECTDDPKGVDGTWKYEWEIKRTKGSVNATNNSRVWLPYSGTMTLHNNFAESAFIIDIDNDNDQFGTDSESVVLVTQAKTTTVTMFDGATLQTLTALSVALKYEDGTSVPNEVATSSATVATGVVVVTVLQNATPLLYDEIRAEITATCAKGTKNIVFTLQKLKSGEPGVSPTIYQLNPTPDAINFTRDNTNALYPAQRTVKVNVLETIGNTTTEITSAISGVTYSWGFYDDATSTETTQDTGCAIGSTFNVTASNAASYSHVWVLLSTGDRETLPIVKDGAKGETGDTIFEASAYKAFTRGVSPANKPDITTGITAATTEYSTDHTWTSAIPSYTQSTQQIYVSKATVKNGTTVRTTDFPADNGWSEPVPYTGEEGPAGKDGWTYEFSAKSVEIIQDIEDETNWSYPEPIIIGVKKGNTVCAFTASISCTKDDGVDILTYDKNPNTIGSTLANSLTITIRGIQSQTATKATLTVALNIYDPDTHLNVQHTEQIQVYIQRLGTWATETKDGIMTETSSKIGWMFGDPDGEEPQQGDPFHDTGVFIRGWQENTSRLTKSVGTNLLQGLANGDGWVDRYGDRPLFSPQQFRFEGSTNQIFSPLVYLSKGWYILSCYTSSNSDMTADLCFDDDSNINDISIRPRDLSNQEEMSFYQRVAEGSYYRHIWRFEIGSGTYALNDKNGYYAVKFYGNSFMRPQLERGDDSTSMPTNFVGTSAVQSQSLFRQTSDSIDLSVTSKLGEAGINIAGSDRSVNLYADKVKFYKNKASATAGDPAKIWIDGGDGSLHAVDGNFSGRLVVKRMVHTKHDVTASISLPGTDEGNPADTYRCAASSEIEINLSGLENLDYEGIEFTFINTGSTRVKLKGHYFCYTIIDNNHLEPYYTSGDVYIPGIAVPVKLMLVRNTLQGWGYTWYVISGIVSSS